MDATIIFVESDTKVYLRLTDHAGELFVIYSVTLVQQGDVPITGVYCTWPTYKASEPVLFPIGSGNR